MSRPLILGLALSLLAIGWAGGHAWSSLRYEAVQIRQLTRLLREELAGAIEAEHYARIPGLFDRHAGTRQVVRVAWTDPEGKVREGRGENPERFPPPASPGVETTPVGRLVAWVSLPPGPGDRRKDWLRLELETLAPGAGWVLLPLVLAVFCGLRLRRGGEAADVGKQEDETCSEASSSPDG